MMRRWNILLRRSAVFGFLVLLFTALSAQLLVPAAQALCPASCEWQAGGRDYTKMYYTGRGRVAPITGGLWLSDHAPSTIQNGTEYVNWMKQWIDDTSENSASRYTVSASTTINLMLGRKGTEFGSIAAGVAAARASWTTWRQLILDYDAQGNVNWNQIDNNCGVYSQANYDPGTNEIFYYSYGDHQPTDCTTDAMIVFRNPDTNTTFKVKKVCGNLLGELGSLVRTTPPVPTPPTPAPTPPPAVPAVKPYFKALGGDVVAGSSFETDARPCSAATHLENAGIVSWNNHGTPDFRGAGGQYGVLARGQIQDFVSGQGNGKVPVGQEKDELSFSNKNYSGSVNYSKGMFGGMFGDGVSKCVNYWGNRPSSVTAQPAGSIGGWSDDKTYYLSGNITLGNPITPTVIPKGKQLTVYIDGNLQIAGTIAYEPGTFTARQDIPSLRLIVNGVIYIDADVTSLDGTYVAVPDDGQTGTLNSFASPKAGTVSTCSSGFSSYDPSRLLTSSKTYLTSCAKPLVVTGSMVAQQLWLLRTAGGLGTTPAETFQYTPEVWLAPSRGTSDTVISDYQSVVGLPPTL